MKKFLSIILTAALICSIGTLAASADTYGETEGEIKLADVTFTKTVEGNTTPISTLEAGVIRISPRVTYNNYYASTDANGKKIVSMIVASFSEGRITGCDFESKDIYGGNNTLRVSKTFTINDPSKEKIEVMLWNNETLAPYDDAFELTQQSSKADITAFTVNGKAAEVNSKRNIIWVENAEAADIANIESINVSASAGASVTPEKTVGDSLVNNELLTVTAENGNQKTYTVKIEKEEVRKSYAPMEYMAIQTASDGNYGQKGMPKRNSNGGAWMNAYWDSWEIPRNADSTATSEIRNKVGNDTRDQYFFYSTGLNPNGSSSENGGINMQQRIWSIDFQTYKSTYSVDMNVMNMLTKQWNSGNIYFGSTPSVRLSLTNYRDRPYDDAALAGSNSLSKYQLLYSYAGTDPRGALIKTLDINNWYNIKVVTRRFGSNDGLIECYINGEYAFDTPYWYNHPTPSARLGSNNVASAFNTNNVAGNGDGHFFRLFNDNGTTVEFGLDNIDFWYAQ